MLCRLPDCSGFVMSTAPLDAGAAWRCMKCGAQREAAEVEVEVEEWERRVESADRTAAQQRELLGQLRQLFHPGHSICVDVMFNMVPLLGRQGGDLQQQAELKLDLVEKIIQTMDAVTPGLFRMRGMFLAELYTTKLFLLRSKLESGQISKSVFVRRLAGFRSILEESQLILR